MLLLRHDKGYIFRFSFIELEKCLFSQPVRIDAWIQHISNRHTVQKATWSTEEQGIQKGHTYINIILAPSVSEAYCSRPILQSKTTPAEALLDVGVLYPPR